MALSALDLLPSLHSLASPVITLFAPFIIAAVIICCTFLYTTLRYRLGLAYYTSSTGEHTKAHTPPYIPYSLPFLGSALKFLAPRPGVFWETLFRSHPRSTGCATVLLGGKETHLLFSPTAVQSLFKNKHLTRDGFTRDILVNAMGLSAPEADTYAGVGDPKEVENGLTAVQLLEKLNHDYLLRTDRVNELTTEYTQFLQNELKHVMPSGSQEIGIYEFLRPRMFKASTTAFMGKKILEICPNLYEQFFEFDSVMLTLFFGLPSWIAPEAFRIRKAVLDSLEKFHVIMHAKYNGKPVSPDGDISWEPDYGMRLNRARQVYYETRGLALRSRAGLDLGSLFGLSSNAIPATGWILLHLLDPNGDKTVLPRIMNELKTAQTADGIDIPTLCGLPLLQSVFHEVLRLYMDVYVTRELKEDLVLPLDNGPSMRKVFLPAKSVVMAPSFVGHRDETVWTSPGSSVFFAERFLKIDPETGKETFTTGNNNGKIFPFGGGKTICPGRVFAKQEVLASVAMVLLTFDIEVLGCVDSSDKSRATFPSLRNGYGGSGIMVMDGDIKVRMTRRKK